MPLPPPVVLVVEDLPSLRDSIGCALREAGYEPVLAADFVAAMRILELTTPALVCLDMTLPCESGLELVDRIRRSPSAVRDVPIVVMSDRIFPEDMANAEEAGANAFLKKPFSPERLLKCVLTLLGRRSPSSHRSFRALQPLGARRRSSTPRWSILQPSLPNVPRPSAGTGASGNANARSAPSPRPLTIMAYEVDDAADLAGPARRRSRR